MASITIRNLDELTKERLRARAAHNRRSIEEEARTILQASLTQEPQGSSNLARAIHRRFHPLGGVDIAPPKREAIRKRPRPAR